MRRGVRHRGPAVFSHPRAEAHGRPASAPTLLTPALGRRWGGRRCVTPRQTCPRPDGVGRNLRSKTRWFTGFCNSHQVSHFATFFIDARAEISVAESRLVYTTKVQRAPMQHSVSGGQQGRARSVHFPWRFSRRSLVVRTGRARKGGWPHRS